MRELLKAGFKKANDEINYYAKIIPDRGDMGTTLVAALLKDDGSTRTLISRSEIYSPSGGKCAYLY